LLRGFADFSGDFGQGMFSCTEPSKQWSSTRQHTTTALAYMIYTHAQKKE
jgi:hypothetical protein